MSSDNAKRHEGVRIARLEWQSELDSALSAIDSRLEDPRGRGGDQSVDQPSLPRLGHGELTSEQLDEIARRVAEEIRRNPPAIIADPPPQPTPAPSASTDHQQPPLRPGKMLLIRYRLPLLPWPFRLLQRRRRKKQHPLTTARVSP
jgi:hypothetical protein